MTFAMHDFRDEECARMLDQTTWFNNTSNTDNRHLVTFEEDSHAKALNTASVLATRKGYLLHKRPNQNSPD